MESIWMGIAPGTASTRVLAMAGPHDTFLKARLLHSPAHPRAMATLLEGIALWQGRPIRAALCADSRHGGSDSSLFRETFTDVGLMDPLRSSRSNSSFLSRTCVHSARYAFHASLALA